MTEYWFKPKRFGYGATPTHWKGWASSLLAVIAVLAVFRLLVLPGPGGVHHPVWEIVLGLLLAIALLTGFSHFARSKTKGEWRWRWGKDSN